MVKLEKMSKHDFDDYISQAISSYAIEQVKAGAWTEAESHTLSEASFNRLLPNGMETEKQCLYSIIDDARRVKVGYLWFEYRDQPVGKTAFVFDFLIFEEFRGNGYGAQAMKALDDVAKKLGIGKISLHVFAHNQRAISLYKKLGFQITGMNMSKDIKKLSILSTEP